MTTEEMIEYLKSTKLYDENEILFYEKRAMNSDKTIPISDLIEHFIETDKYFHGSPWNIRQIIANIDLIIPVEDRGEE